MYDEFYNDEDWDYELDWDIDALHKHKKGDKIKWILTAIALVLISLMLVGVSLQLFGKGKQKPSEWFGDEPQAGTNDDGKAEDENTEERKTQLSITPVSPTLADTAPERYTVGDDVPTRPVVLQAVITPSDTTDKEVDWVYDWKNPNSAWARGKDVANYVTLTPDEADNSTVTVACENVFCESVEITVTSSDNTDLTATCTVDYAKRLASIKKVYISYNSEPGVTNDKFGLLSFDQAVGAVFESIKSEGTLDGEMEYDFAIYGSEWLTETMRRFTCSGRPVTPHTYASVQQTGDPEQERQKYIVSRSTDDLHAPTFKFTKDWFNDRICKIQRAWFLNDEQWLAAYDRMYDHLAAYSNSIEENMTSGKCLLDGVFTIKYNGIEYEHFCKIPLNIPVIKVSAESIHVTLPDIVF